MGFQVTRIREYEVHRVRAEEQAAFRQQLATARARADAEYQETLRGLKEREAAMTAAMQRRERVLSLSSTPPLCSPLAPRYASHAAIPVQELEQEQYEHRQRMLSEMESLRAREEELKRAADLDTRSVGMEEQRLRQLEKHLRDRYAKSLVARERE